MTDYVRELNEGVPRMFQEMQKVGLKEPEFRITDASVTVILYKQADMTSQEVVLGLAETPERKDSTSAPTDNTVSDPLHQIAKELSVVSTVQERLVKELELFRSGGLYSAVEMAQLLGVTARTVSRDFIALKSKAYIEQVAYGIYVWNE
ncbi:hypothetical protein CDA63_09050 [Hymenobacter amundsenii]|uniref:Uncharacterized protein n=2 Tax=Hymenobacter amundsenii TaxID=2006685 RepID=A0A246FLC2_9BACT|nr:hypothetical protein CDA63_09050 [Hymenobacter amundsenii]